MPVRSAKAKAKPRKATLVKRRVPPKHRPSRSKVRRKSAPRHGPFTAPHFIAWAKDLVCDNGLPLVLEPFQIDFVRDLFEGRLENWLLLPEGNGKSTLIAALILYHVEHVSGAWVPIAASSREQAEILYRQAEGFVLRTTKLHRKIKGKPFFICQEGYRRIKCPSTRGRIQIMAADDATGDGVIPTWAICEELHRHKKGLALYRTWRGKIRKRKRIFGTLNAQIIAISTAGEPGSEFEETREEIRRMPGTIRRPGFLRAASAGFLLHDWAIAPTEDVDDMRAVKRANPFSAITQDTLQEDRDSPTMTMEHFARMKANRAFRSANAAINDIEWKAAETKTVIPAGERIDVGVDVAWKWDTTAAVPFWAPSPDERYLGPAKIIEPPRDGTHLHPDEIKKVLIAINERNPIVTVVIDITRAEDIASWIADELGCAVIDWPQTNENEVMQYEKFMAGLRTKKLRHAGDVGLREHAFNAIARLLPNGKTRFDRASSTRQGTHAQQRRRVIDALTAATMVHANFAMQLDEEEPLADWGVAG